jgi:hypothetical protein
VPDLVRFGSKPAREIAARPELAAALEDRLRSFNAAVAYAPHQVYIGKMTPTQLGKMPKPWYEKLIEDAAAQGPFGDLLNQDTFYAMLGAADHFGLLSLTAARGGSSPWQKSKPCATKGRCHFTRARNSPVLSRRRTRRTLISAPRSCWKIWRRKRVRPTL